MKVEWGHSNCGFEHAVMLDYINKRYGLIQHWSRKFEYPWILLNGDFHLGDKVLDAGGGGSSPLSSILGAAGCTVTNIDLEIPTNQKRDYRITYVKGDLNNLNIENETFDKVLCCSVLEHCANPIKIIKELRRVLKPTGKLILTFDVASYSRYNHTIDLDWAKDILASCTNRIDEASNWLSLLHKPTDILTQRFTEENRSIDDPTHVDLNVLCMVT
jgi:ubiquinone/menaquinone biosynthesis C-methylase UbiE